MEASEAVCWMLSSGTKKGNSDGSWGGQLEPVRQLPQDRLTSELCLVNNRRSRGEEVVDIGEKVLYRKRSRLR